MIRLLLRRAFAYYLAMLGLLSAVGCIYVYHPFFKIQDYRFYVGCFVTFYGFFLRFGFFYYLLQGVICTYLLPAKRLSLFTTPAVILLILRRLWRLPKNRRGNITWLRFFGNHHVRTRLLSFAIKAYFGALMVSFAKFHHQTVADTLRQAGDHLDLANEGYTVVYHLLFLVDAGLAAIGYFCESVLLRNRVKSVDPYPISWVVTLACYPPFNGVTSIFFPLAMGTNTSIGLPMSCLIGLKIVTILFYLIYLWATIALNVKFSNLTHRGIVASGPYAFVRHPAYIAKNMAWWTEHIPYMGHGANIVPLVFWNLIYLLRGLYEEKHLSADPKYREYMRKVPYRFIPGVI